MSKKLFKHLLIEEFSTSERYYCTVCDNAVIDSGKPETGKFFVAYGYVVGKRDTDKEPSLSERGDSRRCEAPTARWRPVMFACCTRCLEE